MLVLGKNPGCVQRNTNTISHTEETFIVADTLRKAHIPITEQITEEEAALDNQSEIETFYMHCEPSGTSLKQTEIERDGLAYIAGWIAKKHVKEFPQLGEFTYKTNVDHRYTVPSWLQHLSYGGLTQPSPAWLDAVIRMENVFMQYHGETDFYRGKNVCHSLVRQLSQVLPDVDTVLLKSFVRVRTIIRIRYLNSKLLMESKQKRKATVADGSRKRIKKMAKIVN